MKREPEIVRAEDFRLILEHPQYIKTIGAILDDQKAKAEHELGTATDPIEVYRAQGRWAVMQEIFDQIDMVFIEESAAHKRIDRKLTKRK